MNLHSMRASVLLSGGIDSAACAHLLLAKEFEVDAIFFDFGQPAARHEYRSAVELSEHLGIPLRRVAVESDASFASGEILGRNAFLVFAALVVTGGRSNLIALGVHAGTEYYDCSEGFLKSIAKLTAEQTDGKVSVIAPFISWRKNDIVQYFRSADLPMSKTYSCEAGTDPPCGTCLSCKDRQAFGC
jgi:7-cyano-7-deazaguanine synthase